MRVLVLDALYIPVDVVSDRKAVDLLMRGVAEGVGESIASVLHTPRTAIYIPSVLRLTRYRGVHRKRLAWTRRGVLERDGYTCIYCGIKRGDWRHGRRITESDFTVDHIVPVSRGGKSTWTNTACSCRWCNLKKGDRLPEEVGMKLLWKPRAPVARVIGPIRPEWEMFLDGAGV